MDRDKFKNWCLDCSRVRTVKSHKKSLDRDLSEIQNGGGSARKISNQRKTMNLRESHKLLINLDY